MTLFKTVFPLATVFAILALLFSGCDSSPVQKCVLADAAYADESSLNAAEQAEQLAVGQDVYASVYFIESPKDTEYSVKWSQGGTALKTEAQKMQTDRKGILVFSLESGKAAAGTLTFEISYKNEVIFTKDIAME